jgi:hypothetical protein
MNSKKKLLEAKETDSEVKSFADSMLRTDHPFIKQWVKNYQEALKEGEPEIGFMKGQTTGDAAQAALGVQVAATLEIFNAVIRGFTRYMDDSWVKKYVTDKVVFKIPLTEYMELATAISGGELAHSEKRIDYVTVDLSSPESEKGAKMTWTRSLLEDITFDVQAELMEGLGHAIAKLIQDDLLTNLMYLAAAANAAKTSYGAKMTVSSPITWAQFLAIVGAVDVGQERVAFYDAAHTTNAVTADIGKVVADNDGTGSITAYYGVLKAVSAAGTTWYVHRGPGCTDWSTGAIYVVGGTGKMASPDSETSHKRVTYGPADIVLVSPEIYWELLNIIQLTNVLYEGSTDPITAGRIKLALGCTIVKHGLLPARTVIALNSEKAMALVTRRTLKIEPVLFPVWNEYGFIGTVRFGFSTIFPGAIAIGQT